MTEWNPSFGARAGNLNLKDRKCRWSDVAEFDGFCQERATQWRKGRTALGQAVTTPVCDKHQKEDAA